MTEDHLYYDQDIAMAEEVTVQLPTYCRSSEEAIEVVEENESGVKTHTRHHRGPIAVEYVQDKVKRQKSFSKRLNTFQKQAESLYKMCGASVYIRVRGESGKVVERSYPTISTRTVKVQCGESSLAVQTRRIPAPPAQHSPKRTPTRKINHMPGKKSKVTAPPQKTMLNKCNLCGVIYNSKDDKNLKKKKGLQASWIGCDYDGCHYWAHAVCAGQTIKTRKTLASLSFFCPTHTASA